MPSGHLATAEIAIRAPRAKVWAALKDPAATREYMFETTVTSDWTEGSPITWEGVWEGKPYRDTGVIRRIVPGELLQYSHTSPRPGKPDAPGDEHLVTIRLSDADAATHVALTQDNNPT